MSETESPTAKPDCPSKAYILYIMWVNGPDFPKKTYPEAHRKKKKHILKYKNDKNLAGIRKKHYFCTVNIMYCKHYANMLILIINKI